MGIPIESGRGSAVGRDGALRAAESDTCMDTCEFTPHTSKMT